MPLNDYRQEVLVFNQAAVVQWTQERDLIPNQLTDQVNNITVANEVIRNLDAQIHYTNREITNFSCSISARESQIHDRYHHHHHHHHHDASILDGILELNAVVSDSELSRLRELRNIAENKIANLNHQKRLQQDAIKNAQTTSQQLQAQLAMLNQKIIEGVNFLRALQENPQVLYQKLLNEAQELLLDYENKYPTGQHYVVRNCLDNFQAKIDKITDDAVACKNSDEEWRLKYAQLTGLFWDMFLRTREIDEKFAQTLLTILRLTHIGEEDDLPDEMRTGISCAVQFNIIKNQNREIYAIHNESSLAAKESHDYDTIRHDFQIAFEQIENPLLNKRARALLWAVDEERRNSENSNIKFCLTTLRQGTEMLKNLDNLAAFNKVSHSFAARAEHAKGTPSLRKKVFGVMLGFLGAAIITASILAMLVSFGVSSPLSAMGIALGAVAISYGMQFVSISGVIIGATVLGSGACLFRQGLRHGLSYKMTEFSKAAKEEQEVPSSTLRYTPTLGLVVA